MTSWLGGVVVGWVVAAGCFKPAIEREVNDDAGDGEVEDVGGEVEVEVEDTGEEVDAGDTAEGDAPETVACQGASGLPCDDGDPCTREDRCGSGGCEGIPYVCDDGLSCTEDRCDGSGGCTYPLRDGACLIGGACFAAGAVKADDPCRVCAGGQAWSPNDGGVCEDGDEVCTVGDRCEGLVCVGGPRPSDAATDWALRPVSTTSTGSAFVFGVGRAALRDALLLVPATSDAVVSSTSGDITLAGRSVSLLRRGDSGITIPWRYHGFSRVQVSAFDPPSRDVNEYAVVLEREGDGGFDEAGEASLALGDGAWTEVLVGESTGDVKWRAAWERQVDRVVAAGAGAIYVSGEYTGGLEAPELGGVVLATTGRTGFVARVAAGGPLSWAARLKDPGGSPGTIELCRTGSDTLVVSMSVSHGVEVESTSGQSDQKQVSGEVPSPVLVWFASGASTVEIQTLLQWESHPLPGFAAPPPVVVDCFEDGVILYARGRLGSPTPTAGRFLLDHTLTSTSLIRLGRDGRLQWRVNLDNASLGISSTTFDRTLDGHVFAWQKSNQVVAEIIDDAGVPTPLPFEALAGVMSVDAHGKRLWGHVVTDSPSWILGLASLPGDRILMGGAILYDSGTFRGADSSMEVVQSGDVTPFALAINSSRGLECAMDGTSE